jgi:hypothetical protein
MREVHAVFQPLIHCAPPTDPAFLASVSRAYGEAADLLSGEMAVLVGTLVRIRTKYPTAAIIALPHIGQGDICGVWLVSRDGWTELHTLGRSSTAPPGRTDEIGR